VTENLPVLNFTENWPNNSRNYHLELTKQMKMTAAVQILGTLLVDSGTNGKERVASQKLIRHDFRQIPVLTQQMTQAVRR
jgi:hypothetical protein